MHYLDWQKEAAEEKKKITTRVSHLSAQCSVKQHACRIKRLTCRPLGSWRLTLSHNRLT